MQIKPGYLRSSMINERLNIVLYYQAVRHWNSKSSLKASLLFALQHLKSSSNPTSWKYVPLCTLLQHLTARFAEVSKWNVQRVALKHTFNAWPWHVFITLVQACRLLLRFYYTAWGRLRIVAVQNSNIRWVSLKFNAIYNAIYPLHQTQP